MKKITSVILAFLLICTGCTNSKDDGVNGTFTSTAKGYGGEVKVTVTFKNGEIIDVVAEGDHETEGIGKAALEELANQVLEKGSAEIDGVSGASVTSNAVKQAVQKCIDEANGVETNDTVKYTPGTYNGSAKGMKGPIEVSVTVTENMIEKIEILSQSETKMIGWGLETAPIENLPQKIIDSQSLNIDTITGATVTSNGVIGAVTDALSQTGVDIALLQSKEAHTEVLENQTINCDVVVAGAGGAGIFAAIEAAANGANVAVVEKAGVMTGNSTRNGGLLMASGTAYTDVTNDQLYDYIFNYIGKGQVDSVRIKDFVSTSNSMLEHFISLGTEIDCVENIWDEVVELPVVYMASAKNENNEIELSGYKTSVGSFYMTPLYQEAVDLGVKFYFNTPMTDIMLDENGKVTGIVCERKDGSVLTVNSDATIIATGGYAGDNEKLKENVTMSEGDFTTVAAKTDNGDGIWLAEKIGAAIRYEDDITTMSPPANSLTGTKSESLMLTPKGERFTREFDYFFSVANDLNRAGFSVCYELIDDSFEDELYAKVLENVKNDQAKDIIVADSVEDLAKKLGMDEAVLQSTLNRYNELCKAGNDEDFQKDVKYMKEISTDGSHKLIAMKKVPTICDTYGGIKTDAQMRVLAKDGQIISGLYAAGNTAFTDWVHYEYPGCGYGFGVALYSGHTAGITCLTDLGFEKVESVLNK